MHTTGAQPLDAQPLDTDGSPCEHPDKRMQALYDNTAKPLLGYLLRLTSGRRPLAEDLSQETYLRAWRFIDQCPSDPHRARSWLFTIARRITIDNARASQVRPVEVGTGDIEVFAGARGPDPAAAVADADLLHGMLRRISRQHREVLTEVYLRDTTPQEAAERLGIPLGTVRSRVFYALRSLRADTHLPTTAPRPC